MYALEYVERAFDMSITPTDRNHIKCFAEKYSSATLVTVPSAPVFSLSRLEYQFHLRARLRLPCLLQPYPARSAHLVLGDGAVRTAMHDAARDGFALSAVLSDCVVRPEPQSTQVKPDLIVELQSGQRVAADVFTLGEPRRHALKVREKERGKGTRAARDAALDTLVLARRSGDAVEIRRASARLASTYHPGYLAAVLARGDVFHAAGLTPLGGFYPSARKFITAVQHSGDTLPQWSDAARFEHDGITS